MLEVAKIISGAGVGLVMSCEDGRNLLLAGGGPLKGVTLPYNLSPRMLLDFFTQNNQPVTYRSLLVQLPWGYRPPVRDSLGFSNKILSLEWSHVG